MVNAEIAQNAFVKLKAEFPRVTVKHPLLLGVIDILPRILIFQFKGENGNAVEHKHHIDGIFVIGGIMPLAHAVADVFCIDGNGSLIESRFGLEITDTEFYAPVLEAVAQDGQKPVGIAGVIERKAAFAHGLNGILINKPCPLPGLSFLNEFYESVNI